MDFPFFNTKELGNGKTYDLNDPVGRKEYFQVKLGSKIEEIKEFLEENTFVAFLLAKKSAGKGTYSKMFQEIFGADRAAHLSVGDLVRDTHKKIGDEKFRNELVLYLGKNYRGFMSIEETVDSLLGRSQEKLLPTEFILALVKREIESIGRKALFIDGLPRNLDQISYSLYFRDLINFREDPDFFVLIDVPESVIDERMKFRVVCPECQTSRSTKLLPTKFVEYDKEKKDFYLLCDNEKCTGCGKTRMVRKEGDEKGIEPIRERLQTDAKLMEMATKLQGVPKILVRNSMPVKDALANAEEYELTPEYTYKVGSDGKVIVETKPWTIKDDSGVESHSLLAPAALVSLVAQMHKILVG